MHHLPTHFIIWPWKNPNLVKLNHSHTLLSLLWAEYMNSKTTLTGLWTHSIIMITNYNLFHFLSSTPSPILLDYCLLVEPLFKYQLFSFCPFHWGRGKNPKITFTESATPPPFNTHLYPYLPPSFLSLQSDTLSKLKPVSHFMHWIPAPMATPRHCTLLLHCPTHCFSSLY